MISWFECPLNPRPFVVFVLRNPSKARTGEVIRTYVSRWKPKASAFQRARGTFPSFPLVFVFVLSSFFWYMHFCAFLLNHLYLQVRANGPSDRWNEELGKTSRRRRGKRWLVIDAADFVFKSIPVFLFPDDWNTLDHKSLMDYTTERHVKVRITSSQKILPQDRCVS